jgi:hypothetical protein
MTAEKKKGKYVYCRRTGSKGKCGNEYIREERLADLLGDVIQSVQIPSEVADCLAEQLRASNTAVEQQRQRSLDPLTHRCRTVQAKLDRGYEDYLESKISDAFWTRKSQEWEAELTLIDGEMCRLGRPATDHVVTGEKILELAKNAHFLYKSQDPPEQRRLVETVLSNCTFDRGSLCPTYSKPFALFVEGNQTGNWRREWESFHRTPPNVVRTTLSA